MALTPNPLSQIWERGPGGEGEAPAWLRFLAAARQHDPPTGALLDRLADLAPAARGPILEERA